MSVIETLRGVFAQALILTLSAGPVWSQKLEQIPPGEAEVIEEIAKGAVAELTKRYPEGTSEPVRRDAHAKPHGCAKAVLQIDEHIDPAFRIGPFAEPGRRSKLWLRFSNGAFEPGPDTDPDGRGMAVKIIGESPGEGPRPGERPDERPVHDLLFVNYPVFFVANAAEYLDFIHAGALPGGSGLKRYFFPGYNPFHWRLREAYLGYETAKQQVDSPLHAQYYSMTAYGFGPGRAVKYSARPCPGVPATAAAAAAPGSPDFLRAALENGLAAGPACFELLAQEHEDVADIEDATASWPESAAPFHVLGRIEIPRQKIDSPEEQAFCENLTFNPSHAPADMQPLGSINRVRIRVYDEISQYRLRRNHLAPSDAAAGWDRF